MTSINITDAEEASEQPQVVGRTKNLRKRRVSPGRVLVIISILVFLAVVAGLVKVLNDKNNLKKQVDTLSSQSNKTDAADEAKQLSAEVGKLIELPSDEVPTIATVVDVEKVKSQAFFTNAQNGDKVLLYAKSSKAVLYRPSAKKIIEVAPINLGTSPTDTTGTKKN